MKKIHTKLLSSLTAPLLPLSCYSSLFITMAPSIDAKAVALIAAGSAAVTYLIAKRQFESKIVTERRKVSKY